MKKIFLLLTISIFSINLFAEDCNNYLKSADEIRKNIENNKYYDGASASNTVTNRAIMYLTRYQICKDLEREQSKSKYYPEEFIEMIKFMEKKEVK